MESDDVPVYGSTLHGGLSKALTCKNTDFATLSIYSGMSPPPERRFVNMGKNRTGRSVKACGALGRSDSPCSQSGMDPNI